MTLSITTVVKKGAIVALGVALAGTCMAGDVLDDINNAYLKLNGKLVRIETSVKRIDNTLGRGKVKTLTQRRITATKNGKVVAMQSDIIGRAQKAATAIREVRPLYNEFTTWGNPQTKNQVKELQW
jgi:hypothetical protein